MASELKETYLIQNILLCFWNKHSLKSNIWSNGVFKIKTFVNLGDQILWSYFPSYEKP